MAVSDSAVLPIQIVPPGQVTETSCSPALHKSSHLVSHAASLRACKPAVPAGPGGPAGPAGPAGPTPPPAPAGPGGPATPTAPGRPLSPCGPVGPAGPCGPAGPAAPCCPAGPAAPCGPCGPSRHPDSEKAATSATTAASARINSPLFPRQRLSASHARRARVNRTLLRDRDGLVDRGSSRSRARTPIVCSSAPGISARIRSSARDRARRVAPFR